MRYGPILALAVFSHLACNNQNQEQAKNIAVEKGKESYQKSNLPVITPYPFGCAELVKIKYPLRWKDSIDDGESGNSRAATDIESIIDCFLALHRTKPIKVPVVHRIERLEIGNHFKNTTGLDTLLLESIDSCRYRLPNLGKYECYYSYNRYGNLLLLDPITLTGKLINIYADDLGGDAHTRLRYFYIDQNGIRLYEGYCYDDGCMLDETYKITVNEKGEIANLP